MPLIPVTMMHPEAVALSGSRFPRRILRELGIGRERLTLGNLQAPAPISGHHSQRHDREVSQEHVTLDHTYLNNRALLDGYFFPGLAALAKR